MSIAKLGNQILKSASSGENVTFNSLWQENACVIVFFRRWGCGFCRLWATELSEMSEQLKAKDVRLIGIGVEELGLEDFQKGNFFKGELFVDENKSAYKAMEYKRYNWITIAASLLSSEARAAISKIYSGHLGGDMKGDALQIGGALVVASGGSLLLEFRQERPAEHLPNSRILEALGLSEAQGNGSNKTEMFPGECNLTNKQ